MEGSIRLIIENKPEEVVAAGALRIIEKGECHRILPVDKQDAVYVFVKTHPTAEPLSEDCG